MIKIKKVLFSRCFSSRFSTFFANVPYNFSGLSQLNAPNSLDSVKVRYFLKLMDSSLEQSFLFAYNSILEGLQASDLEFLQSNLEARFFKQVASYPKKLESQDCCLEMENKNNDNFEMIIPEINLFLGARLQRDLNSGFLRKQEVNIMSPVKATLCIPSTINNRESPSINPILQVPVYFKGNKGIKLVKKGATEGEKNEKSMKIHKILFEKEGSNVLGVFSLLSNIQAMRQTNDKFFKDFLQKLFYSEYSEWKVTDIDDFMKGNPF